MSISRKVFNCVVDDTALTTNISEIKKWISQGAITLIIPLYTLDRLQSLRRSGSQIGVNAREAMRFLDRVTSGKHGIPAAKIALQGPMEQFEAWGEAENFFLPEFEEEIDDTVHDIEPEAPSDGVAQIITEVKADEQAKENQRLNEMSQMLLSKLNFKKDVDAMSTTSAHTQSLPTSEAGSSPTSPEYAAAKLAVSKPDTNGAGRRVRSHHRSASGSAIPKVPEPIKPLLNATLWRLHKGTEPGATSINSCILVTNDRTTQTWAQKFGIAAKNIHQLRTAIIYEEREYKNHCKYLEKNQNQVSEPKPLLSYEEESDEDELVFVPRGQGKSRGASSRPNPNANNNRKVPTNGVANGSVLPKETVAVEVPSVPIDPDSFSRNFGVVKPQTQQPQEVNIPTSPIRGLNGASPRAGHGRRGGSRGGGMFRGAPRGRGRLWVP
ncbi:hypothetical protein AJ80_00289 [Polytolypa hystricis UAMH7299]|uniref:PIN domain-containing protein n=1 Tax=Polytolypa hystricis (strain UAMH7299) TaxID=1447883 RepID=A0A2B7YVC9_POLH7|nr:hypothetical protein AJ80_00289 [Polytolypa hystricis UAMH7299]